MAAVLWWCSGGGRLWKLWWLWLPPRLVVDEGPPCVTLSIKEANVRREAVRGMDVDLGTLSLTKESGVGQ